ncbi:hypothetical protein A7P98_02045 [Eikenella sp. NML080894]|uniref:hypothetical protein n=1 Tax=Eikenella TaxID=538 RepID=UPI0007E2111D|nr:MULTISPECIES: hypothetical protein [Eikenella]OAM36761.1 hypothetical protein A7P98_02045 [Eikenella sp. NML080894]OAM39843.1 hypothetical protein A7P99_01115 [Eikenella sp. NML120348]OAM45977.1 hypothetical protein A7Q03_01385 [Eikenella sp. NML99-0057]
MKQANEQLDTPAKLKYIGILAAAWLLIPALWTAIANAGGTMSYGIARVAMFTIFWTILAAVYSLVSFVQTLFGKPSPSWPKILLPALGLWLFLCAYAYL